MTIAGITIVNGADNISVYAPVFRAIGGRAIVITVVVLLLGVALWCALGSWLGTHQRVVRLLDRAGHWIVPAVFVLIGAAIIAESGVAARVIATI
jgi:cadmium resistance protein CadD (predicted permease)